MYRHESVFFSVFLEMFSFSILTLTHQKLLFREHVYLDYHFCFVFRTHQFRNVKNTLFLTTA